MPNYITDIFGGIQRRNGLELRASDQLCLPTELIGVELELEQPDLARNAGRVAWPDGARDYVDLHNDGSLRNGIELVFSQPLFGESALRAIDSMFAIKELNQLVDSLRTSVHVHVNYSNSTAEAVARATAINAIVEPYIVSTAGTHREANCYSVSMRSSGFLTGNSTRENAANFVMQRASWHRYLGFNLTALQKYGTIEYRYFGGMERDAVVALVNMVLEQKKIAEANLDIPALLAGCNSIREFITGFLPHHARFLNLGSVSGSEDADWKEEVAMRLNARCFMTAFSESNLGLNSADTGADYPEDYDPDVFDEPEQVAGASRSTAAEMPVISDAARLNQVLSAWAGRRVYIGGVQSPQDRPDPSSLAHLFTSNE